MIVQFKIEQVALCPREPAMAIALLTEMGMGEWVHDIVVARGIIVSDHTRESPSENVAHLAFNYQALADAKELEVLHYSAGHNWMEESAPRVSHLGMHCSFAELTDWKAFFRRRNIRIAQEVDTLTHSNPVIAGKRWYHYCIFNTWEILGVDIKFIVRKEAP
jgi:hypothetical protein